MKTNFPTKKTFEQDFLNIKWNKIFTLKYEQATIWEYYDYINKTPEEQSIELYDIFIKQVKYGLKDKILKYLNKNHLSKTERWLKIDEILVSIFQNRYRSYKSIFNWIRKVDKKNKGAIDSAWLSTICQWYNISPTDLMKNYTLEQYFWFLDWIEWINNWSTPEWQAINNFAIIDKEAVNKRAEETKAKFAKFKK